MLLDSMIFTPSVRQKAELPRWIRDYQATPPEGA